jgi:hypothetical protein
MPDNMVQQLLESSRTLKLISELNAAAAGRVASLGDAVQPVDDEEESGDYLGWLVASHPTGFDGDTRFAIHIWNPCVRDATKAYQFTGPIGRSFQAVYGSVWNLMEIIAGEKMVELDLDRVLTSVKAYSIDPPTPQYRIGALMFCIGLEIEAAVHRFRKAENVSAYGTDTVSRALAPVMEFASMLKDTAQACGVPVYPPSAPAAGGGTGWSQPTTTGGGTRRAPRHWWNEPV